MDASRVQCDSIINSTKGLLICTFSAMARDIKLCCVLVIFILFVVKVDRIEPRGQYDQPLVDSGQYQMQMTAYEDGSQSELIKEIASEEEKRNTKEIHGHTISRETPTETTTQNCDTGKDKRLINSPFTIVTALFDLGREKWPFFQRSLDTYLAYSVQMLQMEVPMVAYVDNRTEMFVRLSRRGKEHLTVIRVIRLDDLELHKDYDRIVSVMHSEEFKRDNLLLKHPEGFSAQYNILMNSKADLLLEASRVNVFNSTHFFWMDMGYGHGNDVFPPDNQWTPWNLIENPTDKITYIAVNNLTLVKSVFDIYKRRVGPGVNGGFFGGSRRAVELYRDVHRFVFEEFIRSSMMDDDQTVALECYLRYPQLFNMVRGGWYDVFKLFR